MFRMEVFAGPWSLGPALNVPSLKLNVLSKPNSKLLNPIPKPLYALSNCGARGIFFRSGRLGWWPLTGLKCFEEAKLTSFYSRTRGDIRKFGTFCFLFLAVTPEFPTKSLSVWQPLLFQAGLEAWVVGWMVFYNAWILERAIFESVLDGLAACMSQQDVAETIPWIGSSSRTRLGASQPLPALS